MECWFNDEVGKRQIRQVSVDSERKVQVPDGYVEGVWWNVDRFEMPDCKVLLKRMQSNRVAHR